MTPDPTQDDQYIAYEHELAAIERYPYDPVTRMVNFKAIRSRQVTHSNNIDTVLLELKEDFFKYVHPDSPAGKVMKTLIKHRTTERPPSLSEIKQQGKKP